ncbi:MAG: hypothetical protein AVDCRST_MAG51-1338, partial [uncultured Ramlibacter sp.]
RNTNTQDTESIPAQAAVAGLARQQMAALADNASAVFRASEVIQQVQLQAAQRVALLHQQTAEKLREVSSPGDLFGIQSNLMLSGWQETAQYCQELTAAGMKLQSELLGRVGQQQGQASAMGSTPFNPLQAWQNVFTAPLRAATPA